MYSRFSREERHRRPSINSSEDLRIRPTSGNSTTGDVHRVCKRTCANNKNQAKPEPCCSYVKVRQNISKENINKKYTLRSGTQTYSSEDLLGRFKSRRVSSEHEHSCCNHRDATTQNYGANQDPVEERNGECVQEDGKCYITNYELMEESSFSRFKNKIISKGRRRLSLNNDSELSNQRFCHRAKVPECDCDSPGPQSIIQCSGGLTCSRKSTDPFTTVLDSTQCRPVSSELSDIIMARKTPSNDSPCQCINTETDKPAICADCQSCGLPNCPNCERDNLRPPLKSSQDSMTGLSDVLLEKYRKSDVRPQQFPRHQTMAQNHEDRKYRNDAYDECLSDAIIDSMRNLNKNSIVGQVRRLSLGLKEKNSEDTGRRRLTYTKPKYASDHSSTRTQDQRNYLKGGMDGSVYYEKKTIQKDHAPYYEQVLERDSLYINPNDQASKKIEKDVDIIPNCDCKNPGFEDSSSGSDNFKNKRKRKQTKGPILYNEQIKRRTIKNLYIEVHPNMEILRLEENRNPLQKFSTDMDDIILAKCRKRAGQNKNYSCAGKPHSQRIQNQRQRCTSMGHKPVIPTISSGACNNCLPGDKCKNKSCPNNRTPCNRNCTGIDVVQAEERFIAASRVRDTCATSSCSYKPDYKRSRNSVCIEKKSSYRSTKNKKNASCSNYSCKGSNRNTSCISLKMKGCKGSARNTCCSTSYDRYKGGREMSAQKAYSKTSYPCSNISCGGSRSRSSCKSLKMKGCGPSRNWSSRTVQSSYNPSRCASCKKYSQETVGSSRRYSLEKDVCGCNKSSKKSRSNTLYINAIPSGSLRCQECNTEELKESLSRIKESDTEIIVGYKKLPGNKTCCINKVCPSNNVEVLKDAESLEIYCTPSNASSIRNKCSGECSNIPVRPSPKITLSVIQSGKFRQDETKKCTPKIQSVICSQLCTPKAPEYDDIPNEKCYRDCGTTRQRSTCSNTKTSTNVGECRIDEEMEDACCNTNVSKKTNVCKPSKNYCSNTSYSDFSKQSSITSVKWGRRPYKPNKCCRGKSATNRVSMDCNYSYINPRNASTASDLRRVKQMRILCQECNTDSDDIIYETTKSVSIGPECPFYGSMESMKVIDEKPTCCTPRKASPKKPKPQTGIIVYAPCDDCGTQVERQRPPPPPPPLQLQLPPPQIPPLSYICNTSECIQARPPDCGQFMSIRETSGRGTSGRETSGTETSFRETSARETSGRETSGTETSGRETSGRADPSNPSTYNSKIQCDSKLTVNLQPMACEQYPVRPCKQCASSSSDSSEQGFFSRLFGSKPSRTQTSAANTESIRTNDQCVSPPHFQRYEEKETNSDKANDYRTKSPRTQTSVNTEAVRGPYTCDQSVSPPCRQRYPRQTKTCVDNDPNSTCDQYDIPPCNECSTSKNPKWSISKLFGCNSGVDADRDSTYDQYAPTYNDCFANRKPPCESYTSYEDCDPEPYESDGSVTCAPISNDQQYQDNTRMEKLIKTCNSCALCIAGNKKMEKTESPESVSRDTCDIILDKSPRRNSDGTSNNLDIFDEVVPKCREQGESERPAGCYQGPIIKPSQTTLDSCGCSGNPTKSYLIPTEPMDCCVNLCIQRSRQRLDRKPQKIRLSLFKRCRINKSKYNNESECSPAGRCTTKRDRRCESKKKFSREMDDIILDRCNRFGCGQDRREIKCCNNVFDEVIPRNQTPVRVIKNESITDSSDCYEPPAIKPCTCSTKELISVQTSNIQSCCAPKNNRDRDRDRERDRHVSIEYNRRNRCKGSETVRTCKIDECCDTEILRRPKPISCVDFCASCPATKPQRIERDNGTSCGQFSNICPTSNRSQKIRDKPTYCNSQAQSERYPCQQNIKLVRCELKIYKTDAASQQKSVCKVDENTCIEPPKKRTCNEKCGSDVGKTDAVTTCTNLTQNQDAVCYAYNQKKISGEMKCNVNRCSSIRMGADAACYAYKQNKCSGKICRKQSSTYKKPAKCKDVCVNYKRKLSCPSSSLVVSQCVNKTKCVQETVIEQEEEEEKSQRKSPCGVNAPCKRNPPLRIDVTAGNIVPCNLPKCKVVENCREICPNKIKSNLKQCYDEKCKHPYYCNNKCGRRKEEEKIQFRSENDIVLMEKDSEDDESEKKPKTNISCKESKTCIRQKCANVEECTDTCMNKPHNKAKAKEKEKEKEDKKRKKRPEAQYEATYLNSGKNDQKENSISEDSTSITLTQSSKSTDETISQESKETTKSKSPSKSKNRPSKSKNPSPSDSSEDQSNKFSSDDANILSLYSITRNLNQENLNLHSDMDDICNNIWVKKARKLSDYNQELPERKYGEAHRNATRLVETVISEEEIITETIEMRNNHGITMFEELIDASIVMEEKEFLPKAKYVKRLSSTQSTNVIDSSKNNKFRAINKEMETDFPNGVHHKIARGEEFDQSRLTSENQGVSARPNMDDQEVSVKSVNIDETIEFDDIDDSCASTCKRRKTRNSHKGIAMQTNTTDSDYKQTIKNQNETVSAKPKMENEEILVKPTSVNKKTTSNINNLKNVKQKTVATEIYEELEETTTLQKKPELNPKIDKHEERKQLAELGTQVVSKNFTNMTHSNVTEDIKEEMEDCTSKPERRVCIKGEETYERKISKTSFVGNRKMCTEETIKYNRNLSREEMLNRHKMSEGLNCLTDCWKTADKPAKKIKLSLSPDVRNSSSDTTSACKGRCLEIKESNRTVQDPDQRKVYHPSNLARPQGGCANKLCTAKHSPKSKIPTTSTYVVLSPADSNNDRESTCVPRCPGVPKNNNQPIRKVEKSKINADYNKYQSNLTARKPESHAERMLKCKEVEQKIFCNQPKRIYDNSRTAGEDSTSAEIIGRESEERNENHNLSAEQISEVNLPEFGCARTVKSKPLQPICSTIGNTKHDILFSRKLKKKFQNIEDKHNKYIQPLNKQFSKAETDVILIDKRQSSRTSRIPKVKGDYVIMQIEEDEMYMAEESKSANNSPKRGRNTSNKDTQRKNNEYASKKILEELIYSNDEVSISDKYPCESRSLTNVSLGDIEYESLSDEDICGSLTLRPPKECMDKKQKKK